MHQAKLLLRVLTILAILLLIAHMAVLASDITDAEYVADIVVKNNGTSTAANVATTFTLDTQNLIDGNYVLNDLTDTAIRSVAGTDLAYMPAISGSDTWSLFISAISGNAQQNHSMYTGGGTDMLAKLRYFPDADGMETDDSASLELGNAFEIEQSGYVDTSASGYLVRKELAYRTTVSDGNITASILGSSDPVSGTNSGSTSGTTHVVNLPSNISSGDMLIVGFHCDSNPTVTYPAGWTALFTAANDTTLTLSAAYRVSDGTEGSSISVTTSTSRSGRYGTYRIAKGDFTGVPEAGVAATGSSKGPNPPSLAPSWGAANCYWIAMKGSGSIISTYPANYTLNQLNPEGFTAAGRQLSASVEDPGNFGLIDSAAWVANTIAIRVEPVVASVTATGVASGEHTVAAALSSPFLCLGIDAAATAPPVTSGLVLNEPLWQPECSATPFTSVDSTAASTSVSGAVWALNQGYDFDGTDDYLEVAHHANQLLTTGGTIEVWVMPEGWGEANEGHIIDKSSDFTGLNGFRLVSHPDGFVWLQINGGVGISSAVGSVVLGLWYHVAVTWDAMGYTTCYINGAQSGTPGISADPAGITTINPLTIGNRSGAPDRSFNGLIGEVRLYNRPLGALEVLQNYNATKAKYTTGQINIYSSMATIPDNANAWYFMQNNAMPYMEYQKITIGGVLQQHIEWEYDTVFHDLSGHGHDATPTFRTASSDPDVSATFSNFRPISESELSGYTALAGPAFVDTPDSSTYYDEGIMAKFPGATAINEILVDRGIPETFFWYPLIFLGIIGIIFLVFWITRSMLVSIVIGGAFLGFCSIMQGPPIWVLIPYALISTAVVVKRESTGL